MDASEEHYIVGIGASAGGLEALERFFSNVPEGNSLAYVVIQHLSPDFRSHMVELLSKYTTMPVYEAEDGTEVQRNPVYLIPRRKNMILFQGKLYLLDHPKERGLNLPIDIFLESLARDQGEHAVGIILSGTGSDGARGIRAIKEAGGLVMAQDDTARFDGMPRSAIATQLVDYVLPPEAMPANLLSYIRHPHVLPEGVPHAAAPESEVQIEKLFAILRDRTGVDFTDYKPNTVLRRIERRMTVNNIDTLSNYVKYLQYSPEETRVLFKEFLIGVTRFFRDAEAFDYLAVEAIPALFASKSRQSPIRIWVPGCSTGEEAYSLAILCREYMEQSGQYREVKIFATDIDREALETASRGIYPESALADITTNRLQDYFLKRGDTFEVLRQLRSMVVFAYQNVIKDPPFSRMDLISCRNMLIYLQPSLQRKVLSTFQFSLNPGGYLFLGSSESLGETGSAYSIENVRWKVFRFQGWSPFANKYRCGWRG
ncbi:MAG: hypothetical protein IPK16_17370 [Anaerolineales bacterium]|nr:hypothetical protein [Anaerolineales bacterium]